MIELLSNPATWLSLLTLTFLEIVLGIDNIIFISIISNKLPEELQNKARTIGLVLAMLLRIGLLGALSFLVSMQTPLFHIELGWLNAAPSGQALILIAGGIFLLYKSTSEIHHKLEGGEEEMAEGGGKRVAAKGLTSAVLQIALINIVFSIDSILTAMGLTDHIPVMVGAVVISIGIMMAFAGPVGRFVNEHPSIQVLGLAFLIMIGFLLIVEGAHGSTLELFGSHVGEVPKGYLYSAIAFSLGVEFLNMRVNKKEKPVQLHGAQKEAMKEGILDDPNAGFYDEETK